ncbi:hypothetical protein DFJ73DRAFT_960706 [Zopfochytrium polystomum]|nr:hypothetical protein DFJ73DRAFT_960706 [Zopfochytrium polystomum]
MRDHKEKPPATDASTIASRDTLSAADPAAAAAKNASPSKRRVAQLIYTDRWHKAVIGLVILDLLLVFVDIVLSLNTSCTPPEAEEESSSSSSEGGGSNATTAASAFVFLSGGGGGIRAASESGAGAAVATCTPNIRPSAGLAALQEALFWVSTTLLVLFATDVLLHLYVEGVKMFRSFVTSFDAFVIYSSLVMVLVFKYTNTGQSGSSAIVALRIWKMIRVMHAMSAFIEMSHQRTILGIKSANDLIARAGLAAASTFAAASRGLEKRLAALEREAAEVEKVSDDGDVATVALGASQRHAELRLMTRMMDEASEVVDAVRAALGELREQVKVANRQRLERAIKNTNLTVEEVEEQEREEREIEEMYRRHKQMIGASREEGGVVTASAAAAAVTACPKEDDRERLVIAQCYFDEGTSQCQNPNFNSVVFDQLSPQIDHKTIF